MVKFQSDLLHALCDPNLTGSHVTIEWVKLRRPDIDTDWIDRFCAWYKSGKSILDRMQVVAALPNADKQMLVDHYATNIFYADAFDNFKAPPAIAPLPGGLSSNAAAAYRDFFELFYDPIFYSNKGYPIIDSPNTNNKRFSKDNYLEAYHAANPDVKVCPLCDGSMDGAELDHWLAKKHLPELNCYPQNLVEICGTCNSRSNKGEKLALDSKTTKPFDSWFHPHLRPAAGHFEIKIDQGVPMLVSDDPLIQTKLNKLDGLINLSERWSNEYRNQFNGIKRYIRSQCRRGTVFDENGLKDKLESLKTYAEAGQGICNHNLLETSILSLALVDDSNTFVELLIYANECN
ncbi:hypothetical protein R2Q26_12190 [Nitrosomonas sp. Is37]|nr:hypothetical protein [Nitrosomonas sp. Is37]